MTPERLKSRTISLLVVAFLCYSFSLYYTLPVKGSTPTEGMIKGKAVWQKYNCNACHQVYGLGGYLGPDLTNAYSLRGAGYIKTFLTNGTVSMPDFHLSEAETSALLSYLKNIDSSGNSDPRTFTIKNDGTIAQ